MWREVTLRSISTALGFLECRPLEPSRLLRNTKYVLFNEQNYSFYGTDSVNGNLGHKGAERDGYRSDADGKDSASQSEDNVVSMSGKYKVFRDEDSEVIFDIDEERKKMEKEGEREIVDEFAGVDLTRGRLGVFDIDQLVAVLKKQKAQDIFVVAVPQSLGYVSEMVIATGRSPRHLHAIIEYLRKLYKRKRSKNDPIPKFEGENSKDWKALDIGNIALHLFLKSTREEYDLESLWALGSDYDMISRMPEDPLIELLKTPLGLEGLEPASSNVKN
ncbi:hypothetical protein J437_LFUL017572 [Ladona fulva]|uniref:Mitochondrial assembly of ribosomal large subunit protein 1 n=1 Tax=Ladona fulva TaxID=123851 RepID=A0A8K0KMT7_LADFU|nr:hypothetical protein J437_LFUL017572 [Ladona fulva]